MNLSSSLVGGGGKIVLSLSLLKGVVQRDG
jgi:hypothetical protein